MDDFRLFKTHYDAADLKIGLDNAPLTDDDVAQMARALWDDFANDKVGGNIDAFGIFEDFLELLSKTNKGFVYELLVDDSGKCNGCLWQTTVMRDNMERFGSFLGIDAMKRGINSLLWPYVLIALYNELEQVCLGAEGIVVTEREEAYQAIICFALKNAPKLTPDKVYVVTADGFCDQKMVTEVFCLPNACYMADRWHLKNSILPKIFRVNTYDAISGYLLQMMDANTEEIFNNAYFQAKTQLRDRTNRNERHEEALDQFANNWQTYASFELKKKRGTRGKHGSSCCEANHSSVLCFLNDGQRSKNMYCEQPHTLLKDLLARQQMHINKWNHELAGEMQKLVAIMNTLQDDVSSHACLHAAASNLCLES